MITQPQLSAPEPVVESLRQGLLVVAAVVVFCGAYGVPLSANVTSRLATIESLVHRGTFVINDSPFVGTVDKVRIGTDLYSSKPPLLPVLMAGQYWLLRHGLGWSLAEQHSQPQVIRTLAITWVGLPFLFLLGWIARMLDWFVPDARARLVALTATACATPATGYALTINNHVPAAACLVGAAYFAVGLRYRHLAPAPWRFAAAGALTAALPTVDLPGMFFGPLCWFYLLLAYPRPTLVWFSAGALPVLAAHFGLTYWIGGSLVPIYLQKALYHYPGSYWLAPRGIDALNDAKWIYALNLTIGKKGLWLLFPFWWLAVLSILHAVRRPDAPLRWEQITYGLLVVAWIVFYVFRSNNYGGGSYGVRWFIFFVPLLALPAAFALSRIHSRFGWYLVWLLMGVSVFSAAQCAIHPWSANAEWTRAILGPIVPTP